MDFSEKLKILRTEASLTQNELADKLIISRQAISNYEQGRGYPSIDILVDMSRLFNVSLDELLSIGIRRKYFIYVIVSVGLLFLGNIINLISAYFLRQDENLFLLDIFFFNRRLFNSDYVFIGIFNISMPSTSKNKQDLWI